MGYFYFFGRASLELSTAGTPPKEMKITELTDQQKLQLVQNRWNESSDLFSVVEKTYEKNLKLWQNNPEWLKEIPRKRSKARDNRIFLAMESVINSLTGRPSKPNVIPDKETAEAKQIANDLQDFFLTKYQDMTLKGKMRKGLRWLFLSRFVCFKVYWNKKKDDFDLRVCDARKIRVSKKATSMYDTEFVVEEICDKPIADLIYEFPEKEADILKKAGMKKDQLIVDNPKDTYKECWIDGYVIWEYRGTILGCELHPYYDWQGLKMNAQEMVDFRDQVGEQRGQKAKEISEAQKERTDGNYETYLYNYFDSPIPPYVFGTVLDVEECPVGATSLIEQVEPLQEEIDKRKRQISDNAEMMNGVYKIDTKFCKISKADAQRAKSNPRGMWYGEGVKNGVTIETGKELPSFVKDDMVHSAIELDNIFGTQPTFRGEKTGAETATGRAILREQSYSRLDECIELVDRLHQQIYSWMYQMILVKYTEKRLIKTLGGEKATRTLSLMRDELMDGVEVSVIPGQIMPEDRIFKAERAKEEAVAGLIDPLTYFEETGRDNPLEMAKRLIMFKINPVSIIELGQKEHIALQQAAGNMPTPEQQTAQKAQQISQFTQQIQQLSDSPEFQKLPPEQQEESLAQLKNKLSKLS